MSDHDPVNDIEVPELAAEEEEVGFDLGVDVARPQATGTGSFDIDTDLGYVNRPEGT